jgi:hypothetical protein
VQEIFLRVAAGSSGLKKRHTIPNMGGMLMTMRRDRVSGYT